VVPDVAQLCGGPCGHGGGSFLVGQTARCQRRRHAVAGRLAVRRWLAGSRCGTR
jgi:hypothetical protein